MKTILSAFQLCFILFSFIAVPFAVCAQPDNTRGKIMPEPQSDNPDELIQIGVSLYRERKYDDALMHFAKAARLSPQNFRPHALMGVVYQAQRKMKSASESYAAAIQLNPKDKQLYLSKSKVDFYRSAMEEVIVACQKALELDPNLAEAWVRLGHALSSDEKRRSEAIAAYRSALKLDPGNLEIYEPLGEILEENKDLKGAEEIYRKGIAADPEKMEGRFVLGRILVEQGRLVEARKLWNGRTSDDDSTYPNFITLLERAEKLKRTTDALAKKPNDPITLTEMGFAVMEGDHWVMDGRQERAMTYFQHALKINPKYARAQYGICKGYIQLADSLDRYKKDVDRELEKLRKSDIALAKELDEYRKTYRGGLRGTPIEFKK